MRKGLTEGDKTSDEARARVNEGICKVIPEGLGFAFGLVRAIWPYALLADLALRAAIEVWVLIVVTAGIARRVNDVDVEGGFCGRVGGPVVGDDGDLAVDIWCCGWMVGVGGRGTGVEEVLVRVWLFGARGRVVCGSFGVGAVVVVLVLGTITI